MKDSQTLGYMQKAPELNEFVDTQWLTKAGITQ